MSTNLPKTLRPIGFQSTLRTQDSSEVKDVSIRTGQVESFDKTKIYFCEEGQGKTLVFCYGLVCSSLHWTYQIDYFRNRYKCLWFDYRGHQNSELPKDLNSMTIENMAKDLEILLKKRRIKKAVFLGHSMGVNVVLELYKRNPKLFSGMILANGTLRRPVESAFQLNIMGAIFSLIKKVQTFSPELLKKFWDLQYPNPIARLVVTLGGFNPVLTAQEDVDLYIKQVIGMDPEVVIKMVENYDEWDALPWIHEVHSHTLILSGDKDHMIPLEQQKLMHQLIKESQHVIVKSGSHCPQMDLPDLVNYKIEKFLSQIRY